MNRRQFWWAALAVATVLLGVTFGLREAGRGWLAREWQREMAQADDPRAVELVGRVAGLGPPGLPVLVEMLGSPRERVARAARGALFAQLEDWKSLDARSASPRLAALARSLADHVDRFGPTARLDAAELATRILRCPMDPATVDRRRVIDACETVLRRSRADRRALAAVDQEQSPEIVLPEDSVAGEPASRDAPPPRGFGPADSPDLETGRLAQLPGGGLLPAPLAEERPDASLAVRGHPEEPPPGEEPQRLNRPSGAQRLRPSTGAPRLLGGAAGGARPLEGSPPASAPAEDSPLPPSTAGGAHPRTSLDESPTVVSPLAKSETLDLLRGLWHEDPASADQARAELTRRGFGQVELAVGRQLFDPDPEVRKRLARTLPGLRSVKPEPWLLWLARDADGDVRAVAVGLLATSNDPALLAEVERLARADLDLRVRRHGESIARRRAEERR
ncbi:MAG: HEAT repeat domain-containing protein [Pirellulales bacterium]|nr:HEAT repeat domain-containing protein [Pirellulales bacterium]